MRSAIRRRAMATIAAIGVIAGILVVSSAPAAAAVDAKLKSSSVPTSIVVGEWTDVRIEVENPTAGVTWPAGNGHGSVKLGAANGPGTGSGGHNQLHWRAKPGSCNDVHFAEPGNARVLQCSDTGQHGNETFEFQIMAPQGSPTTASFRMRMVAEQVAWFGPDFAFTVNVIGLDGGPQPGTDPTNPSCELLSGSRIRVSSWNSAYASCDLGGSPTSVRLLDQESNSPCTLNHSWGWTNSPGANKIWVNHGCRAVFGYATSECKDASSDLTGVTLQYYPNWWAAWFGASATEWVSNLHHSSVKACAKGSGVAIEQTSNNCDLPFVFPGVSSNRATYGPASGNNTAWITIECELRADYGVKIDGTVSAAPGGVGLTGGGSRTTSWSSTITMQATYTATRHADGSITIDVVYRVFF
ncbi:MAG: DUF3011 domain-containing protein [Actinomycetota bacterium]